MTLLPFQEHPANELRRIILDYYNTGVNKGALLVQAAGTGKTYEITSALCELLATTSHTPPTYIPSQRRWWGDKPLAPRSKRQTRPANILVITPAQVKIQFSRVLLDNNFTNFSIASPTSLVSAYGSNYLEWRSVLRGNSIDLYPIWDNDLKPDVIIVDEGQAVKNHKASISKVIESAVDQGILVILVSATPFTRLSETYITCRATGLIPKDGDHREFLRHHGIMLKEEDYEDYNHEAMKRFSDLLTTRKLKIEPTLPIKFPHRVFNRCVLIDFLRPEHRVMYNKAYKNWVAECQKHNRSTPKGIAAVWAAMTKFRQAAELLRGEQMAAIALDNVLEGKQVIVASNFVATLENVRRILIEIKKVNPDKISVIIGGQSAKIRQENIDKFQRGDTEICLLTLKSGGAGLSLHHEKKYPNAKPRYCILPPTYSAIELVQVLGRAHRITSISTTRQDIIWYIDTIEEDVAERVAKKMKSMKEIYTKRESFIDPFEPSGGGGGGKQHHTLELLDVVSVGEEDDTNEEESLAAEAYEGEAELVRE